LILWLHFHTQLHRIITLQHIIVLNIGPLFLGTFQLEPATNFFDESFATFLKSHERFARQHRSRSFTTHNVASTNSRKDQKLSGIKNKVLLYGSSSKKLLIV